MSIYERIREEVNDGKRSANAKRVRQRHAKASVRSWRFYREAARKRKAWLASEEGEEINRAWKATKNERGGIHAP